MSTIATTLAAGVAQSAHNAEKIARQQDKRRLDRDTDRAELSQRAAEQVASPSDATETDAELPDRQAPGYEQLYNHPDHTEQDGGDHSATPTSDDDSTVETFQHIDVQA